MSIEIKGKIALVTGANRGIGKAIVESFIEHGASKVYLAVRDIKKTDALVTQYGAKVVPVYVDISKPESISNLAQMASDVQILVNNAGVLSVTDLFSENVEEVLQYELNINAYGLLRMARAFATFLEKNGDGAIVQINSVASLKNFRDLSTYSISKAASYSITQGLKDSLADKGITVLSVHPGPIATDMAKEAGISDVAEPASLVSEGIVNALKEGVFHLFPDSRAKEFGTAYHSYSEKMIEV
ncbi:MAG: short-chain dehydrogenase [Bacteroidetes bacterium]|nr:MAG: short-chain dehydrogenase [Bacteroidota bacterium]